MNTNEIIHLGHQLDTATLDSLADFICGDDINRFPVYRSSSYLTRFFQNNGINATHDGSTRKWWTLDVLKQLKPNDIEKIILRLTDLKEYKGDKEKLKLSVITMNDILLMDNLAVGFIGVQTYLKRAEPITIDEEKVVEHTVAQTEDEFLKKQFTEKINIDELKLDSVISTYLQKRVDEIQACPQNKVPLGSIFLLGSTLEGLLLAVASNNQSKFMTSKSAPKDKLGKVRQIYNWKLSELIDVAYETNFIGLDVKKFSHVLRDFRNYIHPYQQMSQNFNPDQHTVNICWQVFKATFEQLKTSAI